MKNQYPAGDVDNVRAAFVFTAFYSRVHINLYLQSKIYCADQGSGSKEESLKAWRLKFFPS